MSDNVEDLIYLEDAATLDGLFYKRVQRSPHRPAYINFDKDSQTWIEYTWSEMAAQVARWREALSREGLQPGDRVALNLRNCPEWVMFEQAALSLGLVVIPLYTDDRPDNIAFIMEDAAVKLLLLQDSNRWSRVEPALREVQPLARIVLLQCNGDCPTDPRVVKSADWLPVGGGSSLTLRGGDPRALATIVYTSGTTGRPKGVMLSHYNILSIVHAGLTMVSVRPNDVFLSFLPLAHTLERTGGYYLPMMAGSAVAYSRSIPQLADDLLIIRPTVMIAVPRIFERIHGRILQQLEKGSAIKRLVFNATVDIGWLRFEHTQGRHVWHPKLLLWPLLNKLVASKVIARLGGRLRYVISGGAPLSPGIARVFIAMGLPLLQGYGLTETSPVISVNLPEDNDPASVGVPLRGIQVRIGENDELQVHSPGVMLGYWNNHAATTGMIDHNGWLKTGDQARIENGHIYITGRIKDILVLSNGEKVPPGDMESSILLDPLIEQVMVIGEGRSKLTALLVLNGDLWPGLAQDLGLDPMSMESLKNKKLHQTLLTRISKQLHGFPSYAKIRKIHLLLEPWSVDNGLLTPTMKVKRAKVLEHYQNDIENLYR